MRPELSVVVPMYNEQEVIAQTHKRLGEVLTQAGIDFELVFVNDGSRDDTAAIVRSLMAGDKRLRLIDFARNFGQESAVSAGLAYARGQAVVLIDADLQDPPEAVPEMMKLWKQGFDVVYGQRAERQGESAFKRLSAFMFYRVLDRLSGVRIPKDTGHFRLMDRKVVDVINRMPEHNRLMRGMVAWVGFRQTPYVFRREERWAGTTKYTLKSMVKLATDGIFSFSGAFLKLPAWLGGILLAFGVLLLIACAVFSWGVGVAGIAVQLALCGLVLAVLGLMGQYLLRALEEVRGRPLYIVRTAEGFDEETE